MTLRTKSVNEWVIRTWRILKDILGLTFFKDCLRKPQSHCGSWFFPMMDPPWWKTLWEEATDCLSDGYNSFKLLDYLAKDASYWNCTTSMWHLENRVRNAKWILKLLQQGITHDGLSTFVVRGLVGTGGGSVGERYWTTTCTYNLIFKISLIRFSNHRQEAQIFILDSARWYT